MGGPGRRRPTAGGTDPQPVIDPRQLRQFAATYLAGHDPTDPSGLPPMLLQAATGDPLAGNAHLLTEHARSHQVDAQLELYPASTHVFQYFWSFLPEAADALEHAGAYTHNTTT
jgi:acetyl esterase/lipase